jgi:hypothetical protein
MSLPNTYTNKNETGCCAVPNVDAWDKKELTFKKQQFVRMYTRSFMFMPLNMAKIMTALQKTVEEAGATPPSQEVMILSRDVSPWKAEQLYHVSKPVPKADNVTLDGTFESLVFEGPYSQAGKWYKTLEEYAKQQGRTPVKTYFFYTTCPNCAKHYGKNYVIGLAQVA